MKIKNVVVIGSGTMGSGIAAQLCNANIPVTLIDLRTEISEKAKKRIFESRPPLLIDKSKIDNIKVGNIDENFDAVTQADWIVEAVVERIDIKHNLYEKILKVRKKDSIISSNTSTIPLKVLSAKMTKEDKKDFCITHFFNPVRYMGLLEIVSESISAVLPSIELVDSRFEDWTIVGVKNLIADNAVHAHWIYGEKINNLNSINFNNHSVDLLINGKLIDKGNSNNVMGNPINSLTWLINNLALSGKLLPKNSYISTGTCTPAIPIKKGDKVIADFGKLGNVSFIYK